MPLCVALSFCLLPLVPRAERSRARMCVRSAVDPSVVRPRGPTAVSVAGLGRHTPPRRERWAQRNTRARVAGASARRSAAVGLDELFTQVCSEKGWNPSSVVGGACGILSMSMHSFANTFSAAVRVVGQPGRSLSQGEGQGPHRPATSRWRGIGHAETGRHDPHWVLGEGLRRRISMLAPPGRASVLTGLRCPS